MVETSFFLIVLRKRQDNRQNVNTKVQIIYLLQWFLMVLVEFDF